MGQKTRKRRRRSARRHRCRAKAVSPLWKLAGGILMLGGMLFTVHTVPIWIWYVLLVLVLAAMVYLVVI